MRKLLRVNMGDLSVREEVLPSEKEPTGGRHLTSSIVSSEVCPTCHPLSAHNKLVVAPGWLGGTGAPCGGRLSVGAKSPLTGSIKESNVGGNAGNALSRLGIAGIAWALPGSLLRAFLQMIIFGFCTSGPTVLN